MLVMSYSVALQQFKYLFYYSHVIIVLKKTRNVKFFLHFLIEVLISLQTSKNEIDIGSIVFLVIFLFRN